MFMRSKKALGPAASWCIACRRLYQKTYAENYRIVKNCKTCNQTFETNSRHARYCSKDCYQRKCKCGVTVYADKRICENCLNKPDSQCIGCGSSFKRRAGSQKFCSVECKKQSSKVGRAVVRLRQQPTHCRWCFQLIDQYVIVESGCCSSSCFGKWKRHLASHQAQDRCNLPICVDCGLIHSVSGRALSKRGFRCSQCFDKYQEDSNRARWRNKNNRRRTQSQDGDQYSVWEIGDRNGWVCWLCKERIDPSLQHPHPGSKSIDHLLPLVDGGKDTLANVQIAHLSCNCARGNRGPSVQLRLIA